MVKREKRYMFCVERFVNGHQVKPLCIFYNKRINRFVIGHLKKKELYPDTDSLRVIVSNNPNNCKQIEIALKSAIKEHNFTRYNIGHVFPVKCDSLNSDYLVSTIYDALNFKNGDFLLARFSVRA